MNPYKKCTITIWCLLLLPLQTCFADNPFITHIYTADPTARVFNGKMFVYTSHDIQETGNQGVNGFCMADYHCFSSEDLITWTDHGVILHQNDVPWAKKNYSMWAPDCVEKGGTYYFYFPTHSSNGFRVGVATASKPEGPFTAESNFITNANGIDPNVYIDDNGTPYLYFGGGDNLKMMTLNSNMKTPASDVSTIQNLPDNYKEGAFVFKRNGTIYFTFPHDQGGGEAIVYATGNNPKGPFTYRGIIMDKWTDGCWTNHHSVVEYNGQWYFFYHHHDLSGDQTLRSIRADYLYFNADGTIKKVTPTLRGIGICKASNEIQIDRYNNLSSSGAQVHLVQGGEPAGWQVDYIQNGGWIQYNDVDFGTGNQVKVNARVSSGDQGGTLEIRVGSPTGQLLGSIPVTNTGGWNTWKTVTANVQSTVTGVTDLVACFKGSGSGNLFNVNWIQFEEDAVGLAKDFISQNNSTCIKSISLHADGMMKLRVTENGNVKLIFYNVKGMKILEYPEIYMHKGKATSITLKRLARGLYYISVELNGQTKGYQKVITFNQ